MSQDQPAKSQARLVAGVWLASRILIGLVALAVMWRTGGDLATIINRWDVQHFIKIANEGYADHLEIAFFPGLPALLNAGTKIGIPMLATGVLLGLIGSALSAWALYRLAGAPAACLWLIAPTAVFTTVPYTEAMFCAAAFWAWERAKNEHWMTAGILAGIACTFRVSGLFLFGALGLLALSQAFGSNWFRETFRRAIWLLIPLAVLAAYVFYLHELTGSWTAWFDAQKQGWSRELTNPLDALRHTLEAGAVERWPGRPEVPLVFRAEVVSMAVGAVTTLWGLFSRRWAEAGWVGVQVFAFATSYWFMSVNRAVLLWFPVFIMFGQLITWRPRSEFLASIWRLWVITAITINVFVMLAWAGIYFTGGWAS